MQSPHQIFCSGILLMFLAAGMSSAQNAGASSGYPGAQGKLTEQENRGKGLYRRYCVGCHGVRGDGNGDSAPYLDPKPRDFTQATFKCRSTASGSLPLDSDLFATISRGVHASGMPSWAPLPSQDRSDLIAYIKTFSPRFREEQPGAALPIPAEPAASPESAQRGAAIFQDMNCWSCHGKDGRGNGPSAHTLTDSRGYPITPYDLTSGSRFKCGETDRDLFRDLTTGLDGTPMPSFTDALKPDQLWDVVHYIRSLQTNHGQDEEAAMVGSKPETSK
jgi:mono/diheme cytochrome c family protein